MLKSRFFGRSILVGAGDLISLTPFSDFREGGLKYLPSLRAERGI
jgi:2',3'-cyclic-nucleotide 2'-phosphodiesterase (5'-nucleotidase family)